jgi:hypothetical protein
MVLLQLCVLNKLSAGDMLPTTPLEVVLSMFFMLCGVSMVALLIGSMTELLTQATSDARRAHALRQKMTEVSGGAQVFCAFVSCWLC